MKIILRPISFFFGFQDWQEYYQKALQIARKGVQCADCREGNCEAANHGYYEISDKWIAYTTYSGLGRLTYYLDGYFEYSGRRNSISQDWADCGIPRLPGDVWVIEALETTTPERPILIRHDNGYSVKFYATDVGRRVALRLIAMPDNEL